MESIKELKEICRKITEKKSDITSRSVRFFSIYFTWIFLHFKRITPNRLTVFGVFIYIAGALCFIKGDYLLNFLGIFLIWLSIVLDHSDGEMARYFRAFLKTDADRLSKLQLKGIFLETFTHDIEFAILFIPLALGAYSSFPYPTLLIFLGFAASMSQILMRLAKLRYIHNFFPLKSAEESYHEIGKRAFYSKQGILRKTIDRHLGSPVKIATWLSLAVIFDKVYLIVILYGIFFSMKYLMLLIKQYETFKKL